MELVFGVFVWGRGGFSLPKTCRLQVDFDPNSVFLVIPAPYPVVGSNRQVRDKLQQESSYNIMDSREKQEL